MDKKVEQGFFSIDLDRVIGENKRKEGLLVPTRCVVAKVFRILISV